MIENAQRHGPGAAWRGSHLDPELAHVLPTYTHPAALVVDEVGYLTNGTGAASMYALPCRSTSAIGAIAR